MTKQLVSASTSVKLRLEPDAAEELAQIAEPYLKDVAKLIGDSIVQQVPVDSGAMRDTFKPTVDETGDGVRLHPNSPFWHWLEYGTPFTPVYRPIERGVRATGARYEPS
jgi:Bacteriophage HK97-gp10, putative tail-component